MTSLLLSVWKYSASEVVGGLTHTRLNIAQNVTAAGDAARSSEGVVVSFSVQ